MAPVEEDIVRIVIEGTTAHDNSYGVVNLHLADALRRRGHEVGLRPWDQSLRGANESARAAQLEPIGAPPCNPEVWIRQWWPPVFERPRAEYAFVVQPFEFGAVPAAWVAGMRELDGVLVPSEHAKQCWLQGGADHRRVWIVPNGVVAGPHRVRSAQIGPLLRVGFVGGAIWRKGIDLAVASLDHLDDGELDRVRFVVKESGHESYYAGQSLLDGLLAAHPRVAARTEVVRRRLDAVELSQLYTSLDVLLAPYRAEGFGLPILEAMAHGVVPIVPGHGPASEFVDASCGVFVASALRTLESARTPLLGMSLGPAVAGEVSTHEVARQVRELLNEPERRLELARGASQRASLWTWDRAAEICEQVVTELAAGRVPSDRSSRLIERAARGGAQGVGALVELGDFHGALELAEVSAGSGSVLPQLRALSASRPDIWRGALHRGRIPVLVGPASAVHVAEGDAATQYAIARVLAPLLASQRRVVDVGCGEGGMLRALAALGVEAVGIDVDPERVARLHRAGFAVEEGDALEVLARLDTGSFDGAFVGHLIEHLAPPLAEALLAELARVLAPGSVLVIQTPNPSAPGVMAEVFWLDASHVRPYPPQTLVALAQDAGFRVIGETTTSLAPLAPLDNVVVFRRRPTQSRRAERLAPPEATIVTVADPASGFARASRDLVAQLARVGIRVRTEAVTRAGTQRVLVHDLPLAFLATGVAGSAPVARTAWEVRGVPREYVRVLARYDRVVTYSSWCRDVFVEAGLDEARVGVLAPRVEPILDLTSVATLRATREPRGHVLSVLTWGDARKNPAALVQAFARARASVGRGLLTLKVRGATASEVWSWIETLLDPSSMPPDAVQIVPEDLDEAALWRLYLEADTYCLPTRGEGFGLPFLEAMSAGCAVIAPAEGGHRDVVDEAQWLVDGAYQPVGSRRPRCGAPTPAGRGSGRARALDRTAPARRTWAARLVSRRRA